MKRCTPGLVGLMPQLAPACAGFTTGFLNHIGGHGSSSPIPGHAPVSQAASRKHAWLSVACGALLVIPNADPPKPRTHIEPVAATWRTPVSRRSTKRPARTHLGFEGCQDAFGDTLSARCCPHIHPLDFGVVRESATHRSRPAAPFIFAMKTDMRLKDRVERQAGRCSGDTPPPARSRAHRSANSRRGCGKRISRSARHQRGLHRCFTRFLETRAQVRRS